ncbi:uncharacterized protein EDB91DRAFT_1076283 [Suillus paluster]|uniref:uncharacterized protein n=1 Tax=Suillus paluster TaxID=48578 RepID=UPI001B86865B|nr:uncharacterized protein EDB91DRAFT_1076283 [Suillus paluster]KAG1756181.1 hypothetical protein EDB91DRAFT_1076283 [Suillus paluster]
MEFEPIIDFHSLHLTPFEVGLSASTSAGFKDIDFLMGSIYLGPEDDLPVPSSVNASSIEHIDLSPEDDGPEPHPGWTSMFDIGHCTPSTSKPTSPMSEQELLRMSKSILHINSLDDNTYILELERPFHTAFTDNTDKLHRATKDLRQMEKQRAMNLELLHMLDHFITQVQDDWHTQQDTMSKNNCNRSWGTRLMNSTIIQPFTGCTFFIRFWAVRESLEAYIIPVKESLEAYIIQDKYLP